MTTEAVLARITIDPEICHGKPCIRHLRYPIEVILELLSSGMTMEDILPDYDDFGARRHSGSAGMESSGRLPGHVTTENILTEQLARNSTVVRCSTSSPILPTRT